MSLTLEDKVLAEVRTVWQYHLVDTTTEEIIEYFDTNYGIATRAVDFGTGEPRLVFQSYSGSTSHNMVVGDYLIINQTTLQYEVISEIEHDERVYLAESLA